jgi:magnesium chelatase family protein
MKVKSFVLQKDQLIPIQVEVTLLPGLPQMHFLGLPDQNIKESVLRIRSSLKHQGFDWPKAHQVVVNLRPSTLKKSSRGLELAVAAAYLWETQQMQAPLNQSDFYVYGELSLTGEVFEPADIDQWQDPRSVILTGVPAPNLTDLNSGEAKEEDIKPCFFRRQSICHLKDLGHPKEILACAEKEKPQRSTQMMNYEVSTEVGQLLHLCALGQHSLFLAGPAGTGKTTLAHMITELMKEPSFEEFDAIQAIQKSFGTKTQFRPFVVPHHSTPRMALIGGGNFPKAGEVSRAHGGVLLMDEFLEFHPSVLESLREPMEEGIMRVARAGRFEVYPAQSLVIAATNLCPCGDFVPGQRTRCGYSLSRCQSTMQKISGPLLDRFQLIFFMKKNSPQKKISLSEIYKKLEKDWSFQNAQNRSQSNAWMKWEELKNQVHPAVFSLYFQESNMSRRRQLYVLRVARTFADADHQEKISNQHIEKAIQWSYLPCLQMKEWGGPAAGNFGKEKSSFYP